MILYILIFCIIADLLIVLSFILPDKYVWGGGSKRVFANFLGIITVILLHIKLFFEIIKYVF